MMFYGRERARRTNFYAVLFSRLLSLGLGVLSFLIYHNNKILYDAHVTTLIEEDRL